MPRSMHAIQNILLSGERTKVRKCPAIAEFLSLHRGILESAMRDDMIQLPGPSFYPFIIPGIGSGLEISPLIMPGHPWPTIDEVIGMQKEGLHMSLIFFPGPWEEVIDRAPIFRVSANFDMLPDGSRGTAPRSEDRILAILLLLRGPLQLRMLFRILFSPPSALLRVFLGVFFSPSLSSDALLFQVLFSPSLIFLSIFLRVLL